MNNRKIIGSTFAILGVIVTLLSLVILPFCKAMGEMVMRCHNTSVADGVVGVAIFLAGLIYATLPKVQISFSFIVAALGTLAALVPTILVGVCENPHMHCHAVSAPVLLIAGIIIALAGIANGVYQLKRNKGCV